MNSNKFLIECIYRREYGERINSGKQKVEGRKGKNIVENLLVWKKAHELTLNIYEITKDFPKDELFGLTSQMRRSSTSVPCNIVEGKARGSSKDFRRFLLIARGSLEELKYQILLSKDLKYIDEEKNNELQNIAKEVGKLLNGLMVSLDK